MASVLNIRPFLEANHYVLIQPNHVYEVLRHCDGSRSPDNAGFHQQGGSNDGPQRLLDILRRHNVETPIVLRNKSVEALASSYKLAWTAISKAPYTYIIDVVDLMHHYSYVTGRPMLDVRGCLVAAEWAKAQGHSFCFIIIRREFEDLQNKKPWSEQDNAIWQGIIDNGNLQLLDVSEPWLISSQNARDPDLHYSTVVSILKEIPGLLEIEAEDLALSTTCRSRYGRSLRECISLYGWALNEARASFVSNDCPFLSGFESELPQDQLHYYFIDGITMRACVDSGRKK